jgi:hypothetical protein
MHTFIPFFYAILSVVAAMAYVLYDIVKTDMKATKGFKIMKIRDRNHFAARQNPHRHA